MKKIVISGWYGCGNVGDEAILTAILDTLRARYPEARFVVVSEGPERVMRDYGDYPLRAVLQRSYYYPREFVSGVASGALARVVSAIRGADLFLLGGGGLLRDNTSRRNVVRVLDECVLARLLGVPVAYFAIGVGPIATPWGARFIRWVSDRVNVITVRDSHSAALLKSIGVTKPPIHVTADPAFLLTPSGDSATLPPALRFPSDRPLVGIFPCEGMFWRAEGRPEIRERVLREVAALCDRLAESMGFRPVLVPFRVGTEGDDDLAVMDEILERVKTRDAVAMVREVLAPRVIRTFMGSCRYVVGARLHSLILATAAGVPVVGVNYEPKVKHFLDSVPDQSLLVEPLEFSAEACVRFLAAWEQHYDERKPALKTVREERARAALRGFDLVAGAARPSSARAEGRL